MKRHRITLTIGLAIITCSFLSFSAISAYLADGDSARNAVVVGGNNISIDEEFNPEPIAPGAVILKKVRVCNEGPNSCYVRARVVFSDSQIGDYANVDWNLKDWIYNASDEYYYYPKAIHSGDFTSWLMTTINISDNIPKDKIQDVDVIVYAESYQSFGYLDYKEAWADYKMNLK